MRHEQQLGLCALQVEPSVAPWPKTRASSHLWNSSRRQKKHFAAGGAVGAEHAVADRDARHVVAGGDHLADELVADHEAGLDLDPPVVDVEVRAADAARLDADDRVVGREQLGLRDLVDLDLARGLEGDRAHRWSLGRLAPTASFERVSRLRRKEGCMGIEKSRPVLITGCSTGIGRATAERLADDGWNVYATARRAESIEDLSKKGCKIHALDVTDEGSMESAVAEVGEGRSDRRAGQQRRLQPERRDRDDPDGERPPAVRDQRLRPDADVPARAPGHARGRAPAGSST